MSDVDKPLDFHTRLRRIEAEHRRQKAAEDRSYARSLSLTFLRLVAVLPVWLIVLKGLIMAQVGVAAYGAQVAVLASESALPDVALALLRPDPFSLTVMRLLGA